MTLIEFIGFMVSMFALIYLMGRRAREERQRRKRSPEVQTELDRQRIELKKSLKELDIPFFDEEEEEVELEVKKKPPPLPPIKVVTQPVRRKPLQFSSPLATYDKHYAIEDRHLESSITDESINVYKQPIVSYDMTFDDQKAYEIVEERVVSRIQQTVAELPSLKQMVIFREILGRPKAFGWIDAHEIHLS